MSHVGTTDGDPTSRSLASIMVYSFSTGAALALFRASAVTSGRRKRTTPTKHSALWQSFTYNGAGVGERVAPFRGRTFLPPWTPVVAAAGVLASAIATRLALSSLRDTCSYSISLLSPPVVLRTQGPQHNAFSCVAGCTTGSPQNRCPSHVSRFTASTLMRRPSARRSRNARQ